MQADHCNIHAVYNNLASRRLNDSKQTQSQRRFTSTSPTNNSNLYSEKVKGESYQINIVCYEYQGNSTMKLLWLPG